MGLSAFIYENRAAFHDPSIKLESLVAKARLQRAQRQWKGYELCPQVPNIHGEVRIVRAFSPFPEEPL